MQYKILRVNDNLTAQVEMTIDSNVLIQDFPVGQDQKELQSNIEVGMAVFNEELSKNTPAVFAPYSVQVGQVSNVAVLPVIPPEDFLPEPVMADL
jgi:hypothetical protein